MFTVPSKMLRDIERLAIIKANAAALSRLQINPEQTSEPTISDTVPLTPRAQRLAHHVIRVEGSSPRLAYRTPRIEASYPAVDGASESVVEPVPLRELRARSGISLPTLARLSSVSVSTIHRVEHGETVPRPRVVRALSAALGVAPWQVAEFQSVLARVGLPRPAVVAQ
jgi:hypothetical protein